MDCNYMRVLLCERVVPRTSKMVEPFCRAIEVPRQISIRQRQTRIKVFFLPLPRMKF